MPSAPEGSRLKLDWDGSPVAFGSTVRFECEHSGLYFNNDREQEYISLECLENGYFRHPYSWPKCVESKKNKTPILLSLQSLKYANVVEMNRCHVVSS